MLNHNSPYFKGWKVCPSCGYAHDKDGKNLLTKEESNVDMELDSIPDLKTSEQSQYNLGSYSPRSTKGGKHD